MLETISSICSKMSCEKTTGEGSTDNKTAKNKKPDTRMHAALHGIKMFHPAPARLNGGPRLRLDNPAKE
jgi:hypothetical protein